MYIVIAYDDINVSLSWNTVVVAPRPRVSRHNIHDAIAIAICQPETYITGW